MTTNQINVFFVGAIDGDLEEFYDRVKRIEDEVRRQCDWVLCTGHLGTWVSPAHIPGVSSKKRGGRVSDFNEYFKGNKTAAYPTVFVTGSQDHHRWLKKLAVDKQNLEICENISWLRSGNHTVIGNTDESLAVVGLGNSYSPKTYNNIYTMDRFKHFKRSEVNRACTAGKMDIFISHSAPKGVTIDGRTSINEGVDKIIFATQPRLVVHNGLNASQIYSYYGTKAISLKVKEIVPVSFTYDDIDILGRFNK